MGDVINLRQMRKHKARADHARAADANRAKFGRTKAEKQVQQADADRQARLLDGTRRDHGNENPSPDQ